MKPEFGLPVKDIKQLSKLLHQAVANTYDLYLQTLNCHWNIEDPRFLFLHEMLQKQYEQLAEDGDELAERIRQMGEKVEASLDFFAKKSSLKKLKANPKPQEMIGHLATCHEQIIFDLRDLSSVGEECGDYGLVDMLGGMIRTHEKTAWFLRSHL